MPQRPAAETAVEIAGAAPTSWVPADLTPTGMSTVSWRMKASTSGLRARLPVQTTTISNKSVSGG